MKRRSRPKKIIQGFLIVLGLMFIQNLQAQQLTVTGQITDENDQAAIGVNIVEKGTTNGAVTDYNGNYTITVGNDATLIYSFIGMISQEIRVGGNTRIDIVMATALEELDEVVVTGYMTQRKVDLTGAITIVDVATVLDIPKANPLVALQGRVPGLYIEKTGRPSGNVAEVLIRGANTLGNNSPLYIIDGVPTKRGEIFASLDVNSIESIQVLKDASAASIYGARASNGVIIVTTKPGKGEVKVEFSSKTTMQKRLREVDVLNTMERGEALWQASINDGTDPGSHAAIYGYDWHTEADGTPVLDQVTPVDWIGGDPDDLTKAQLPGTDWQDETFRTGWLLDNNLTVSGGGESSTALLSIGYLTNKGIMEYQDFEKLTVRFNSTHKMLDGKLKVGQNLNIASTSEVPRPSDLGGANMEYLSRGMQPILPVYKEDGDWAGPIGAGFSDRNSPIHMLYIHRNNRNTAKMIFGNIFAELEIIENLKFRTSIGVDYTASHDWWVEESYQTGFLGRSMNSLEETMGQRMNWTWSNTLTYDLQMDNSSLSFLAGTEAIKDNYHWMGAYKENFALNDDYDYITNLSAGTGLQTAGGSGTGHQLLSYFGKVNYAFSSKYLASATLRYDGSSRFGTENQYGFFPAATLGWRINNEDFFTVAAVSHLKLRAGIGRVGNQEIGDVARFGLYRPNYGTMYGGDWTGGWLGQGTAYDLYGANTGTLPSGYSKEQSGNAGLKWESTDEFNIGVDFGLFEQKLTGSFDYFLRETRDILIRPPVPSAVGEGGQRWENGATVKNTGFEFVLGYKNQIGDFRYDIMGSVQHFQDEITYLPEAVVRAYPGNVEKTILGHSQRSLFGYQTDGIFQTQGEVDAHADQPGKGVGRIRYIDLNGDGQIDPLDQDWLGTSLPQAEYGVNVDLMYKNWSFNVFMNGIVGKNAWDGWQNFATTVDNNGMNFGTESLNAWTAQNTDSNLPALSLVNANDEGRSSDYMISNHSYFKVRSIQLAYTLPSSALQKIRMRQLRIFLMAENMILLADRQGLNKYWGPDPEHGFGDPLPVSLTLGVNVSF